MTTHGDDTASRFYVGTGHLLVLMIVHGLCTYVCMYVCMYVCTYVFFVVFSFFFGLTWDDPVNKEIPNST